ncbi:hypothetical protein Pcinc_003681 [Petrolisthes cinctipes]|uniref:Uncharacterized protein n=1 Tax=Petrolisthes cinctipes TaxID=88211 RepID=A0AAE1L1U1_PETCI|nr:hypothetical protein Pcinc_003681 [Petrolisthes cinctipes]
MSSSDDDRDTFANHDSDTIVKGMVTDTSVEENYPMDDDVGFTKVIKKRVRRVATTEGRSSDEEDENIGKRPETRRAEGMARHEERIMETQSKEGRSQDTELIFQYLRELGKKLESLEKKVNDMAHRNVVSDRNDEAG